MLRSFRHARLAAFALVVLAAMAGVVLEDAFVHTDDGCEVERHCTACRTLAGSVATPATAPTFAVPEQRSVPLTTETLRASDKPVASISDPRGPPSA